MTATRTTAWLFAGFKIGSLLLWPWNHVAAIACFFGIDAYVAWQIVAPPARGFGRGITRFDTPRREVWLTIDDGPDPQDTPQILALLAHHQATATFFVIGEQAARFPHMISAIRAGGHEIGHHTHTHPIKSLWAAGPRRFARELDEALAALAKLRVTPTKYRAPGGTKCMFQEQALAQRGLRPIVWSIRAWDTIGRNPAKIVRRILRQTAPGEIILLHEGVHVPANIRVKLIAQLLVALDKAGYRCVIPTDAQFR